MFFTIEFLKEILKEIASYNYCFSRFDNERSNVKKIYLRHDVDISPYNALKIGQMEFELNCCANFFFQIGAETYNIFSDNVISIIKQLRDMGHCVGLHIDEQFGTEETGIRKTIDWFSTCITPVDNVISFHRPTKSVINQSFSSFINAYETRFLNNYLSDSRRNHEFYPQLQAWMKEQVEEVQLLLHPVWWCGIESMVDLKRVICERKIAELEQYLIMNFRKVFEQIIAKTNTCFKL